MFHLLTPLRGGASGVVVAGVVEVVVAVVAVVVVVVVVVDPGDPGQDLDQDLGRKPWSKTLVKSPGQKSGKKSYDKKTRLS